MSTKNVPIYRSDCQIKSYMVIYWWSNRIQGVLTSFHYIMKGGMRMKFDFKDLMAFGMFILALLTLITRLIG